MSPVAQRAIVLCLAMGIGCSRMSVEGTVLDGAGDPLSGALVALEDSPCDTRTDPDGHFWLSCAPSQYLLSISLPGHHSETVPMQVPDRIAYTAPALVLLPEAPSDGLWQLDGTAYTPFEQGALQRTATDRKKAYCLAPEDSPSHTLLGGSLRLLDQRATAWKLFRLDEEGCAQRLVWRTGAWRIDSSNEPVSIEQRLGEGHLYSFDLEVGEYFLADWGLGRFAQDAERSASAGDKRYSGAHLIVR